MTTNVLFIYAPIKMGKPGSGGGKERTTWVQREKMLPYSAGKGKNYWDKNYETGQKAIC